jgi:uncharacterized protein DUF6788
VLHQQSLPPAERELYSKLHQILTQPGLLRGNLVELRRTCGKPTCRCTKNKANRHHSLYLSLSRAGKRRMVYIPSDWEAEVRDWVGRYKQVREVLEKLSASCLLRLEKREV